MRSIETDSIRKDGSEMVNLRPLNRSLTLLTKSTTYEKSDDDNESKANSSMPVALMAASAVSTISSTLRSRTGRVIMPAWQNRQPRVHPRMISTETRLCTTSIFGTMNFVGGGGNCATMRLTTGLAIPSINVSTWETVPSSM